MDRKTTRISFICILIITLIVGIIEYFSFNELKENGKYAIGEITSNLYTKGVRKEMRYKFKINIKGKFDYEEYRGIYTPFFFRKRRKVKKGEQYLVVYSEKKPKNSLLILDKPIKGLLNLDSLNRVGIDLNDVTYWQQ